MSYKAQQWALEQEDVCGLDKWVLFMLAFRDSHDEPHGCFPSIGRVAKDCGIAKSTVKNCLKRLVSAGKVHVERRSNPEGDQSSNFYTFPEVWVGRNTAHPPGRATAHGGPGDAPGVGRNAAPNLKATSNEPKTRGRRQPASLDLSDLEQRRKIESRDKRLDKEREAASEAGVGNGPQTNSRDGKFVCPKCGAIGPSRTWLRAHRNGIDTKVACPKLQPRSKNAEAA
jgi:hypothetical protein